MSRTEKYHLPHQFNEKCEIMRFTDELRIANGPQWDRVTKHKFTTELAAGTMDKNVIRRYLIQDHRFLDSFIILLASIVAHARTLEDRLPGCQFLALITGKENTYFERSFEWLGVSATDREGVPDADCTIGFCNLMKDVAGTGNLSLMLSVIVVCEWTYLSWGVHVKDSAIRQDFIFYEWIDLHTGSEFENVVEYLRRLLDKEASEHMDEEAKRLCHQRFSQAMQLEEDFFDFAYTESAIM
jgi:thiaminase (transcriptional activator TenA)